ncbi:MAG: hypothetical protein SV487_11945, partial [Thermodesulfobacteriota bacterium]|nr:hypothetical protein [Thermodesulfobacteriota bacterium]
MTAKNDINGLTQAEKAGTYNRLKRRLGYVEFGLGAAWLLLLLISGLTFDLRDLALGLGGGPAVWVLAYFFIAALFFELLTLPLNILSGFFLEKRFDLLNQSASAWTWDYVKAVLLSLVLGGAVVELLYLFLGWAGRWWWIPAGGAFALFFVLLTQLTPVLILPLFFKFKPLPETDFSRRLMALCDRAGAPVLGIYEWELSARTRRANAALAGWGP